MNRKICDIHAHIVPHVDDGAQSMIMAMELLRTARDQGVCNIVCSSHSGFSKELYLKHLELLMNEAKTNNININLYSGCEVYCDSDSIDKIIDGLDNNKIPTINETKYVLVEFSPYVVAREIMYCVEQLHKHSYRTIIAHVERYLNLFNDNKCFSLLQDIGSLFQVNAYSIQNETNVQIKEFARNLLKGKYVTFLGSDAHRTNHRPYMIQNGIDYIYRNCDVEYANDICYKNAMSVLNLKAI